MPMPTNKQRWEQAFQQTQSVPNPSHHINRPDIPDGAIGNQVPGAFMPQPPQMPPFEQVIKQLPLEMLQNIRDEIDFEFRRRNEYPKPDLNRIPPYNPPPPPKKPKEIQV